ncbi:MAG: hypothetical protein PVH18_10800 [Chloroflexota bacterium]|jgi:hypothetical protein
MSGIPFSTVGKLFTKNEQAALLLTPEGRRYTLRLGLVVRGAEEIVLPEILLDDWGHQIGGLALYQWVEQNAPHFPRAELFGFDLRGQDRQYFIRDLDLTAKYACYLYEAPSSAIADGTQLTSILLPVAHPGQRARTEPPADVSFPLANADLRWWLVQETLAGRPEYDFYSQLQTDESD